MVSTSSPRVTLRSMITPSNGASTSSRAHCWTSCWRSGAFSPASRAASARTSSISALESRQLCSVRKALETAIRSAWTFRWASRRVRSGTAPSAEASVSRCRLSSSRRNCDRPSTNSLFFSPRSWLQITAKSCPLRTGCPKATGRSPLPALPNSTTSPGKRAWTCASRSESRISEPESSRLLGRVDGWAGSVRTSSRLATSAGKVSPSFFPANSGPAVGDVSAAAGVVMPDHQDAKRARCAIPAPIAATSTTNGRAAFNPR